MEENDLKKFIWPVFLIVTGICFFFFKKVLFWIDGTRLPIFSWIGLASFIAGIMIWLFSFYKRSEEN